MKTMIRKEWGSPKGNVQEFTPQEFVAQCEVKPDFPTGMTGDHFYVDGLDSANNNCTAHTPDNISGATEHINGLKSLAHIPSGHDMAWLDQYYHNTWHVHQAYYDLTGQQSSEHRPYSDSFPFKPVVVLHLKNGSTEWYYLADGHVGSSDPWSYIPDSIKNHS